MKKRYLAIAGLLVFAIAASGCGRNKEVVQDVQVTPTPQPTVTEAADLVDMEVTEEKNVIGEKTASASKVTIINRTGDEVGALYIREHPEDDDDDEWGSDLINGMFTLPNGEQTVYYFEKSSDPAVTYDIRITYTEEDKNECFFRDLPLGSMSQITLRMDGSGEDSIPYATYMTSSNTKEVSTLNDVKKRLGLTEDTDEDDDEEEETTPTPIPEENDDSSDDSTNEPTYAPEPTSTPDDSYDQDDPTPTDDTITQAEGYIGQSFEDLVSSLGEPQSNEYEDEPDTGRTGYHYYSNFTVSTTVDEYGNETVAGIW